MTQGAGRAVEVAIVGGGPAGAALAIQLARAGHEAVVFERWQQPRWRACGVFSSPLTRRRLASLGLSSEELRELIRPISGMAVETTSGATCLLTYPPSAHACGLDRVRLEAVLIAHARAAGAEVREGAIVRSVEIAPTTRIAGRLRVSEPAGTSTWRARLVVGADGPGSMVARAAGVAQTPRRLRKAGITLHLADPEAAPAGASMEGRFVLGDGWYVGLAPVPGGRLNVGIVIGEAQLRRAQGAGGIEATIEQTLARLPGPRRAWQAAHPMDQAMVALPLAHRTRRAAGTGFLLVGDAAGFIDPLSGDGLHRALASAELAARAVADWSRGDGRALGGYDQRLRTRYRTKDVVSWLLQVFLAQPALLSHAVRRLGERDDLRATFTAALADRVAASRVLDPRFVASLLLPLGRTTREECAVDGRAGGVA